MQTTTYPTKLILFALTFLFSTNICADDGVFVVTNTADSGTGSLREAMTLANADPTVPHIINFFIGSGVQTITPASALPTITSPYTLIDGTTQPGWTQGNPQIIISGSALTPYTVDGLSFSGVNYCMVRGLVINGGFNNGISILDGGVGSSYNAVTECFIGTDYTGTTAVPNNNGIAITGSTGFQNLFNKIGSANSNQYNLISGNNNCGIAFTTNASQSLIQNNLIGTNKAGTSALPNAGGGVSIIGSLTPVSTEMCDTILLQTNVISGNGVAGVFWGANAINCQLLYNNIGVDISGTVAVPNDVGMLCQGALGLDGSGAVSGGYITNNLFSGNSSHGVVLENNVIGNYIVTNSIGLDVTNTFTSLGNGGHGIVITGITNEPSTNNIIGGGEGQENVIAYNGAGLTGPFYGVLVTGDPTTPSNLNSITGNSIFNNNSSGIVLLNNGNDAQAAPTVINALLNANGSGVTVAITAPATPVGALFDIDVFINTSNRPSVSEGKIYLGTITKVPAGTNVVNLFPLSTTLPASTWASATATTLVSGQPADTSPFSANYPVETIVNNIQPIMFESPLL